MKILVTGVAGFIGFHLAEKLLNMGIKVIGIDNMNDYYSPELKYKRLQKLKQYHEFAFYEIDIVEKEKLYKINEKEDVGYVVHLAAQAGVRYSLENPDAYIESNIIGFFNILEFCRKYSIKHLIYASSSSVYGDNRKIPFEEEDNVDSPISLYAATKKSNELMAYTYSHLYKIKAIGLRFFTVYGPYGRPDMAYFDFVNRYFQDQAINIYNNSNVKDDLFRDFTFIDDIIEAMVELIKKISEFDTYYEVFNIGNSKPIALMQFINTLEECLSNSLGKKIEFKKIFKPTQSGDVKVTYASTRKLEETIGFKTDFELKRGLQIFTDWYVDFYKK